MKKVLLSLLLSIFSTAPLFANGGVGGAAGGGGVKPELQRVINFRNGGIRFDQRQAIEVTRGNLSYYTEDTVLTGSEAVVEHGQVQFNLNEIEEITLKDGSVVKYFELLELMKK